VCARAFVRVCLCVCVRACVCVHVYLCASGCVLLAMLYTRPVPVQRICDRTVQ